MLFGYAHAVCAACAGMRLVQLSLLAAWLSMHFGQGQLGPSVGRLSRIIKCVEEHIHAHTADTLRGFHPGLFTREKLAFYSAVVAGKGCMIPNTFGFIDGCRWMVARPGGHPQYQVCVQGQAICLLEVVASLMASGCAFVCVRRSKPCIQVMSVDIVSRDTW